MLAILGGLGAAVAWTVTTMSSARAARLIGAWQTVAWVMTIGLVLVIPMLATSPAALDGQSLLWLAVIGFGNVGGLWIEYIGLRLGRVGVVAPIVSAEGAVAALIAAVAGEAIAPAVGGTLLLIAAGIVLAAGFDPSAQASEGEPAARVVPALLGLAAAVAFGATLFATGKVSSTLPLAWILLPPRLVGFGFVALPLALRRRMPLPGRAAPFVIASGIAEVVGFTGYALGARRGIAVASVIGSEFAAIAAVAAWVLFRERLSRMQVAGVTAIAVGVGLLSLLRAWRPARIRCACRTSRRADPRRRPPPGRMPHAHGAPTG